MTSLSRRKYSLAVDSNAVCLSLPLLKLPKKRKQIKSSITVTRKGLLTGGREWGVSICLKVR